MMKEEFEKLIGKTVSDSVYETIEFVYTWHPAISDVNGKRQIADLYLKHGMSLIRNMYEPASIMQLILGEEAKLNRRREKLRERRIRVENGNLEYERCRKELKAIYATAASAEEGMEQINSLRAKYDEALVNQVREEINY